MFVFPSKLTPNSTTFPDLLNLYHLVEDNVRIFLFYMNVLHYLAICFHNAFLTESSRVCAFGLGCLVNESSKNLLNYITRNGNVLF